MQVPWWGEGDAVVGWSARPCSRALWAWLAPQWSWLVVERLTAYAPELSPGRGPRSSFKVVEVANLRSPNRAEVINQGLRSVPRQARGFDGSGPVDAATPFGLDEPFADHLRFVQSGDE
jgi:hypothetical protein